MSYVYMYQAALYCEPCGEAIRKRLTEAGEAPEDADDEESYDSDEFPKGPIEEGESDTPTHCDACHAFLENELTSDGAAYVKEACEEALCKGEWETSVALKEWMPFYDPELSAKAIRLGRMTERVRVLVDAETGKLPKYSSIGSYPIYYVTGPSEGAACDVCCATCANDHETGLSAFGIEGRDLIRLYDVNYENAELFCECGERIESAYAEEEATES